MAMAIIELAVFKWNLVKIKASAISLRPISIWSAFQLERPALIECPIAYQKILFYSIRNQWDLCARDTRHIRQIKMSSIHTHFSKLQTKRRWRERRRKEESDSLLLELNFTQIKQEQVECGLLLLDCHIINCFRAIFDRLIKWLAAELSKWAILK